MDTAAATALWEALRDAESLDEVLLAVSAALGPRYVSMVCVGCMVLGGVVALYVVYGFATILRTPPAVTTASGAISNKSKAGKAKGTRPSAPSDDATKAHRGGAGTDRISSDGRHGTANDASDDAPKHDADSAGTVDGGYSLRTRSPSAIEPSSVIRGFSRIGVLATSPCQEYMIVTCRRSGKARLFPQNNKRLFMKKGKELQDHYFVSLDDALRGALGVTNIDVSMVAFHGTDGSLFAMGESITDTIVVFKTDGKKAATVLHQWKLPKRRLVSSLGSACSLGGAHGEALIVAHDANAEVELLHAPHPPQGPGAVAQSSKEHFSIGHALTWSLAYPHIVVGGSFMKEARMVSVLPRYDFSDFTLKGSFVAPMEGGDAAATADGATGRRVCTAVGLVSKHQPEFNQRAYLVVLMATGEGYVYDVSGDERPDIVLRGRFTDGDYATTALDGQQLVSSARIMATTAGRSSVVGMSLAVSGAAYHERLCIALWTARDVAVHIQQGEYNYTDQTPFRMSRVLDIHDATTTALASVVFVQHGQGLATCGSHDDHVIRLWTVPTD